MSRRRYAFAPVRWGNVPHSARRHKQVPPYIHRRTADMGRRAGPVCPAAGMHRKQYDRVIGSNRVGRGLAPAAGMHSPGCGGGPSHIPHGGTRRCRPTYTDGLPTWDVGRDLCVPPPVRIRPGAVGDRPTFRTAAHAGAALQIPTECPYVPPLVRVCPGAMGARQGCRALRRDFAFLPILPHTNNSGPGFPWNPGPLNMLSAC